MNKAAVYVRRSLKYLIPLAIIAVLIFSGRWILDKIFAREEEESKHIQIETVQRAMFVERISERGDLEALEEVEIKSDVAGVIKKLYVEDGDNVQAGQELFKIDDEYIRQRLRAVQADYDVTNGQLEQAKINKALEIKRIENNIDMARKNLELAQANMESVSAMSDQQIIQAENSLRKLEKDSLEKYKTAVSQAELALQETHLVLQTKQSALELAKSEEERYKKLFEQKFVSEAQYEEAQNKLNEAQAAYESAQGSEKSAQLNLDAAKQEVHQLKADIEDQKESLDKLKVSAEAQRKEAKLRVAQQKKELENLLAAEENQKKDVELRVMSAEKYKERSEAELNRLKEELSWTLKHAPRSGTITDCIIEEGQAVASGRSEWGGGEPIMKISDLSQMVVKTYVNEIEIAKINLGQRAEIHVSAYRDRVFDGKVWKVAPAAKLKDNIRSFEVTILITNVTKELRPQMTADVDIIVGERKDILQMPISALIEKDVTLVYTWIKEDDVYRFKGGKNLNIKLPNNEKLFPSEVVKTPEEYDKRYIDDQELFEVRIRVKNNPGEFDWGPPRPMDLIFSQSDRLDAVKCEVRKEREPFALLIVGDGNSSSQQSQEIETQEVPIVIGKRNENNIEIIRGLSEDDRIKVPELSRKDLFMWED
ncbi:HlyD family efflux transporter periplasmic adaptor subunit [Candidatus Poribacteria bacterium]|nr:HlyD family efflux transporter periplasmic adaptor subunit [Candidatus Poribacteria bacterium]